MTHGLHPAAVAATGDAARRSRPAVVRSAAAFPRLTRRLGVALARSRPSRLRTALLLWGARHIFDAWTRRDWEVNTFALDPSDYELSIGDPSLMAPGMRERYLGVEGYIESQLALIDVFPDMAVERESVAMAGPTRIVAMLRWKGTAGGSGVFVDQPMMTVADFPDGMVTRQSYWFDPEAGLRKLGLTPPRR